MVEIERKEAEPKVVDVAYAFSGQGSYDFSRLPYLLNNFTIAQELFARAKKIMGEDFINNLYCANVSKLMENKHLQAGIVFANFLMFSCAHEANSYLRNYLPKLYVGHSLGEWDAYLAADVVVLDEALPALKERETYMTGVPGKMVRVFKKPKEFIAKRSWGTGVTITLINTPDSIIIGGSPEKVDAFLTDNNIGNSEDLGVPVLAHHEDLREVAQRFGMYLINNVHFRPAKRPILVNGGSFVNRDPAVLRYSASNHLVLPVDVPRLGEVMIDEGIIAIADFSTSPVLSVLLRKTFKPLNFTNPRSLRRPESDFLF